jgi:hypothetical protein
VLQYSEARFVLVGETLAASVRLLYEPFLYIFSKEKLTQVR